MSALWQDGQLAWPLFLALVVTAGGVILAELLWRLTPIGIRALAIAAVGLWLAVIAPIYGLAA